MKGKYAASASAGGSKRNSDNVNWKRKTAFLFDAMVRAAVAFDCVISTSTLLLKIQTESLLIWIFSRRCKT